MAINKFQRSKLTFNFSAKVTQRSRLTFNFSAKVTNIGVPSTHLNIVSSETTRPIGLQFHMKTPYDRLAKIFTNCTGDMAKTAIMPIYGKNPLYIFISGTKRPMALGLVM